MVHTTRSSLLLFGEFFNLDIHKMQYMKVGEIYNELLRIVRDNKHHVVLKANESGEAPSTKQKAKHKIII